MRRCLVPLFALVVNAGFLVRFSWTEQCTPGEVYGMGGMNILFAAFMIDRRFTEWVRKRPENAPPLPDELKDPV